MNFGIKTAVRTGSIINRTIAPASFYKHYKGSIYCVKDIAKHTETDEDLVIYYDTSKPNQNWARPVSMFNDYVLNDGFEKPRFELL